MKHLKYFVSFVGLAAVLLLVLSWLDIQRIRSQLKQERISLSQKKADLHWAQIDQNKNRVEVLSGYFQTIQLFIDRGLKEPSAPPGLIKEAEKITLETLPQLDGRGKGELLLFLYSESLIGKCPLHFAKKYCQIPGRVPILSLVGADLRRAKLREISLNGADLRRTDLRGVNFRDSDLTKVDFRKANLSGANLSTAVLYGADLSGAFLRVAILKQTRLGCYASCSGTPAASLRQADLQGADLTGANLGYVSLEGGNLREALLINAKLAGAKLEEASFVDADLAGAHLSYYWKGSCSDFGWEARVATVNNTDFTNANLSGANLLGLMKDISSGIEGAELSNANLDAVQIGSGPEGNC